MIVFVNDYGLVFERKIVGDDVDVVLFFFIGFV